MNSLKGSKYHCLTTLEHGPLFWFIPRVTSIENDRFLKLEYCVRSDFSFSPTYDGATEQRQIS